VNFMVASVSPPTAATANKPTGRYSIVRLLQAHAQASAMRIRTAPVRSFSQGVRISRYGLVSGSS
jgi:hypothetical protein